MLLGTYEHKRWGLGGLTVYPCVGSADCWDRGAPGHDELVILALVVSCFGLRKHKVVKVQPKTINRHIMYIEYACVFACNPRIVP